jgi:hypothetical protein
MTTETPNPHEEEQPDENEWAVLYFIKRPFKFIICTLIFFPLLCLMAIIAAWWERGTPWLLKHLSQLVKDLGF